MLETLLFSLPMIVCGVLSMLIALSIIEHRDKSRWWLLLFMVTATVLYMAHFVFFSRQTAVIPLTDTFYSFCNPAVFPLYYLYIEELTAHQPNRRRQILFLLPSLACFLTVGLLYLLMTTEEVDFFVQHYLYHDEYATLSGLAWWQGIVHGLIKAVFALQIPAVLVMGFRRVTDYNRVVESNYSDVEGKRIVHVKPLLALFAVASLVSFVFNMIGRYRFAGEAWPLMVPSLLFSLLLLLVGHVGLSQHFSACDIEDEAFEEPGPLHPENNESELVMQIRHLMESEKLYLSPSLKVGDLTERLCTNRTYIYQALNVEMGVSFSDYVNMMRVDHAARLLEDEPDMPIGEVMIKSGFTSSSAFYRNYKKFKGATPSARRA